MAEPDADLPIDPGTADSPDDAVVPLERERIWDLLLVIAAGGAIGGAMRFLVGQNVAPGANGFPWATFIENVLGAFLLGMLMVFIVEVWPPNRYLRPFLGVGVLGGFTTFSAFADETRALLMDGAAAVAGMYMFGSVAAALLAVFAGMRLAHLLTRGRVA